MSDLKDQILGNVSGDMDIFKKIASKIPGFKGYIESQARRDSDKVLRDVISSRFRELEAEVSSLQGELGSAGDIDYIDDLEKSAIKLRTFADRVRMARRGYSGFFDAVKVDTEVLDRVYSYDAALLDMAEQVKGAIDNIRSSVGTDGLPASIRNLESVSRQCIEAFDRREEILTGAAS